MKESYLPRRKHLEASSKNKEGCPSKGVLETFSSSIPQEEGFYWYWSPYREDFVVAEAVIKNGKMQLKIDNGFQAFFDEGAFIHSKIERPKMPTKALKRKIKK